MLISSISGRLIAALIEFLSPNEKTMRLPTSVAPFKVAVILPNQSQNDTMKFAEGVVEQLSRIPSLFGEVYVDDRFDNSIGRRLLTAVNLS